MTARPEAERTTQACDVCPFAQKTDTVTTVLLDGSVVEVGNACALILPSGERAYIKRTYAMMLTFLAGGEVFSREEILAAVGSKGQPKTAEVHTHYLNKLLHEIRPELSIKNMYSVGWYLAYQPK